jgi:hypothetical protein
MGSPVYVDNVPNLGVHQRLDPPAPNIESRPHFIGKRVFLVNGNYSAEAAADVIEAALNYRQIDAKSCQPGRDASADIVQNPWRNWLAAIALNNFIEARLSRRTQSCRN